MPRWSGCALIPACPDMCWSGFFNPIHLVGDFLIPERSKMPPQNQIKLCKITYINPHQ